MPPSLILNDPAFVGVAGASAGIDLTGLLVYWKMAEASSPISNSSTSSESLGSSGQLTMTGGTFQEAGIDGSNYSLLFDGTDDTGYIDSSTTLLNTLFDDTYVFTINYWAKLSTSGGEAEPIMIQNRSDSGASSRNGVQQKFAGSSFNKTITWIQEANNTNYLAGTTGNDFIPTDTDWHMYTLRGSRSSGEMTIRLDDSTSYTITESSTPSGAGNADKNFFIGSEIGNAGFWGGYTTEWSIWERELTDAEVTTIFNNGTAGIPV